MRAPDDGKYREPAEGCRENPLNHEIHEIHEKRQMQSRHLATRLRLFSCISCISWSEGAMAYGRPPKLLLIAYVTVTVTLSSCCPAAIGSEESAVWALAGCS